MFLIAALLGNLFIEARQSAFADDWGYEENKTKELSAQSMLKSVKAPQAAPKTPAQKAPVQKTAVQKAPQVKSPANKAPGKSPHAGSPAARNESMWTKNSKAGAENAGLKAGESARPQAATQEKSSADSQAQAIDAYIDKDQQAARCWLQLFQTVSSQKMDYVEQKKLESYMLAKGRLSDKYKQEFYSIMKFWPKLINDLKDKPEMEPHYADLFKALLRLHEQRSTEKVEIAGSDFSSDADLISRLLGLQRIAVSDTPPFTEDAVNAYADMAFFIYEQEHAGRTIDANDNRTLFAKVVVEKFNRAPDDASRKAMASFDLAWAKFKVIWYSSDEATRKLLLSKLVKSGAGSTLSVRKDPLLDLVLSNWPWDSTP